MWQLRNGGEVAVQSSFLYSALVVNGIKLPLNPPQRKPPTVRAHSNAHSASNIYLSVLRNHYSEIFPLFLDASFVTASCF
jgi:hypothetical protein